jgi:hypothetical protein
MTSIDKSGKIQLNLNGLHPLTYLDVSEYFFASGIDASNGIKVY